MPRLLRDSVYFYNLCYYIAGLLVVVGFFASSFFTESYLRRDDLSGVEHLQDTQNTHLRFA